ncbi:MULTISPECIES: helix-turn-helix domain-containing protein [unclassified Spirillospora]|uniref:helix-turn-helix domain-containing protein n=1 Tax=unclassified Spirillospora TaxID=2642701 RepID=UPI0033DD3635
METLKSSDLDELPTVVSIVTAARALGLSRTYAYELAKRGDFPCRVIRIGAAYRVPTAELLKLLGVARQ